MQYEEILGTNNEVIYRSMEYNESNLLMGFYTESWDEWFTNQVTIQGRYRYTSSGWRIRSQVGSVVTRTVREGARALGDFEAGGIVRHWNLSGGLGRLGISGSTERSALRYYFSDHLGSLRAVATSAGTVVEARDYYAFGLEMPGRTWTPSLKTREGYTGHQLDAETGFNYAGARYYNPGLARWMVVDPLEGEFPAWSPFKYVLGNPLSLIDPDGMAPKSCCTLEGTLWRTFGWAESRWNDSGHRIESARTSIRQRITMTGQNVFQASGLESALSAPAHIRKGTTQVSDGLTSLSQGITVSRVDQVLEGVQMQLDGVGEISGFVENAAALASLTPAVKVTLPVFATTSQVSTVVDVSSTVVDLARVVTGGSTFSRFVNRTGWTLLNASMPGRVSQRFEGREPATEALVGNALGEIEKQTNN